jgi:hypothetical protein
VGRGSGWACQRLALIWEAGRGIGAADSRLDGARSGRGRAETEYLEA